MILLVVKVVVSEKWKRRGIKVVRAQARFIVMTGVCNTVTKIFKMLAAEKVQIWRFDKKYQSS